MSRLEASLATRVRHLPKGCTADELQEALSYLSAGDAEEVVVVPLFFASSVFSEKMVPSKLGLGEGVRTGTIDIDGKIVRIRIVRPFGTEPGMRDVIETVLERSGTEPGRTAVILIGHGSKDGANSRAIEYNAEMARELGFDAFPCYNEMHDPTVEDTLEEVLCQGFDDILAIPMFVSSSNHSVVEIPEKLGLDGYDRERTIERDGRIVHLRYATEIGLEPGVADILQNMVEE